MRPRRFLAPLLAAALVASGASTAGGTASSSGVPDNLDQRLLTATGETSALVHVRRSASLDSGIGVARSLGADIGTVYRPIKVFVAYATVAELSDIASRSPIQWIEANSRLELLTDSSHEATRSEQLAYPKGSRRPVDGRGVGVAVVDSGVDGLHPDLSKRMGGNVRIVCSVPGGGVAVGPFGFSECRGPKVAVPLPDTDTPGAGGHGTHVAGIVAGTGAASKQRFHGAAPKATLYGVGVGTTLVVENALDGLAWVLANHDKVSPKIRVVNNSWGGGTGTPNRKDPWFGATVKLQNALIKAGVTVVFAAGNSGGDGTSQRTSAQCANPKPGLVCVANYDDKDKGTREGKIDGSSSRGDTEEPVTWPDVAAPGTNIISTCRATLPVCHAHFGYRSNPPNAYAALSGTSMAAPHVAGVIAQMYQVNPRLRPARVEDILEDTAYKFSWGAKYKRDPFNRDDKGSFVKGHGLVDAMAAVKAARRLRR